MINKSSYYITISEKAQVLFDSMNDTNATSGSHEFSHTMQSNLSLLTLKIDKDNSTDNGQNTYFYLDNVTAQSDVLQIKEENNYYPFGLKHKGYNNMVNGNEHPYKYNGKELNQELGYNVYDYQARHYEPAIGRWLQIDPLAEDMTRFSPYNFAFGNPIYYIDPDGMSPFDNYFIHSDGSILRQVTDDKTDTFTLVDDSGKKQEIGTFDKNEKGLINAPNIDNNGVKVTSKPGNDEEINIAGTTLASVIGASSDSGEEMYITRASNKDGSSPGDSETHTDGKNIDIRFAQKDGKRTPLNFNNSKNRFDKIDTKAFASMNASLNKFGFKNIRASQLELSNTCLDDCGNTVTRTSSYSIPGTTDIKDHFDHEHLEKYYPNVTVRELQKPVSNLKTKGIAH